MGNCCSSLQPKTHPEKQKHHNHNSPQQHRQQSQRSSFSLHHHAPPPAASGDVPAVSEFSLAELWAVTNGFSFRSHMGVWTKVRLHSHEVPYQEEEQTLEMLGYWEEGKPSRDSNCAWHLIK